MKIENIRNEIDKIDNNLKVLFLKRLDLVKDILEYKKNNKLPILDKKREDELINRLSQNTKNEYLEYYLDFLNNILDISKRLQKDLL